MDTGRSHNLEFSSRALSFTLLQMKAPVYLLALATIENRTIAAETRRIDLFSFLPIANYMYHLFILYQYQDVGQKPTDSATPKKLPK